MIARKLLAAGAALAMLSTSVVRAQEVAPNDLLLATLWTQRSVEYKATALTVFALAQIRLDQALADKSWTAAPGEQKGDFASLPPAVILDVDETLVDNSLYQVWMLKNNQTFSTRTWNEFCAAQVSRAIPGAVEFTKYADSKGVKIFYITNRDASTEKDTRENMAKLGFPMGGKRRAVITKDYRVLLNIGDNFGDFDDRYRGSEADRLKAYQDDMAYWGKQWLMLPNPTYGSFDSATYGHDFKKPVAEQRKAKWDVIETWVGPK